MSCEDYPCCGHAPGDCPSNYDSVFENVPENKDVGMWEKTRCYMQKTWFSSYIETPFGNLQGQIYEVNEHMVYYVANLIIWHKCSSTVLKQKPDCKSLEIAKKYVEMQKENLMKQMTKFVEEYNADIQNRD